MKLTKTMTHIRVPGANRCKLKESGVLNGTGNTYDQATA
jgi:hypothetical protein